MKPFPLHVLPLIALFATACTDKSAVDDTGPAGTADRDADLYTVDEGDCDDYNAAVNPAAAELWYDGIDQDCDGNDTDQDGDGAGVDAGDCDDTDAAVNPSAAEVCDGVDNDCEGTADAGATGGIAAFVDADLDGHGDPASPTTVCGDTVGAGFVIAGDDCDDADAAIYPGAEEVCDDLDNNCDGQVNEGSPEERTYYRDADADGYGDSATALVSCTPPEGYTVEGADCNDAISIVHPGADESCDGTDRDCDGDPTNNPVDGATYYADADGDGFGDPGTAFAACTPPEGLTTNGTDCDDAVAATHPTAAETCDGTDNDCDGGTDEAGASGESTWYIDADADGYGSSESSVDACDLPFGYADNTEDCDDADVTRSPAATEADDDLDNDCDGEVDEGFVAVGDVIISEVTRQPRIGGSSTNTNAQWFELYNTTGADIDLSDWYIARSSSTLAEDGFTVDPASGAVIAAGGYALFCKTDNFDVATTAFSTLSCDYYWGDETEAASYAGTYQDNTFNLQPSEDRLQIYAGGSSTTGTLIDDLAWFYDATEGYWPREATRSMTLDPAAADGVQNDAIESWCANIDTVAYAWYYVSSSVVEYGTPGTANYDCP